MTKQIPTPTQPQQYCGVALGYMTPRGNGKYDWKKAEIKLPTFDETDQFVTDFHNNFEQHQTYLRELIEDKTGDQAEGEIVVGLTPIRQ